MSHPFIILAKIGKPFGLKGFLKVHTYTDTPEDLLDYPSLFIKQKAEWLPCHFEEHDLKRQQLLVKFKGFDTPEAAQAFTNLEIGAQRDALSTPEAESYYWSDLEGLTVINTEGRPLGTVQYLINTGASDLMVIKGEQEHIVPFVMTDIVQKVDLKQGIILVNWTGEFQ